MKHFDYHTALFALRIVVTIVREILIAVFQPSNITDGNYLFWETSLDDREVI